MRVYLAFLLMLCLFTITFGQAAPRPASTTSAPTPEPERVVNVNRDLKTQIFEVKNRDPLSLVKVLRGLSSDDRGTQLIPDKDFKTITVRDYPENIAVIERALARLDVPEKLPTNLEFQLHVLAASRSGKEKSQIPNNLEEVVKELQSTLQYSNYRYVTTLFNRVQDGKDLEGQGTMDPIFNSPKGKTGYSYRFGDIRLGTDTAGNEMVQIGKLSFGLRLPVIVEKKDSGDVIDYRDSSIFTGLSLREGEKVVVGAANVGSSDEAIILVLSVKRIK